MKEIYKYEKLLIISSILAVGYIFGGCAERPKVKILDEATKTFKQVELKDSENTKFICSSDGLWYEKTGTTKLEIVRDGDSFLTCNKMRF